MGLRSVSGSCGGYQEVSGGFRGISERPPSGFGRVSGFRGFQGASEALQAVPWDSRKTQMVNASNGLRGVSGSLIQCVSAGSKEVSESLRGVSGGTGRCQVSFKWSQRVSEGTMWSQRDQL